MEPLKKVHKEWMDFFEVKNQNQPNTKKVKDSYGPISIAGDNYKKLSGKVENNATLNI